MDRTNKLLADTIRQMEKVSITSGGLPASAVSSSNSKGGGANDITLVAAGIRKHHTHASVLFEQQLFQEELEERQANAKDSIVLNFLNNESKWIALQVKTTQTFAEMKKLYIKKMKLNLQIGSVSFLSGEGVRLHDKKTPAHYNMENEFQIDVFLEGFGGGTGAPKFNVATVV